MMRLSTLFNDLRIMVSVPRHLIRFRANFVPKQAFFLVFFLRVLVPPSYSQAPFITTWKTDNYGGSCNSCIRIPTLGTGYNYDVDWNNDGVYDEFGLTESAYHNYGIPGIYQVAIRGDFPRIFFIDLDEYDKRKIISIDHWGDIEWESFFHSFYGCVNLQCTATDSPNLTNVTSLYRAFMNCHQFNGDLSGWDTKNITDMGGMFFSASSFNQDVSRWDTRNVTNMYSMFYGAISFNQNIGSWTLHNDVNMFLMLYGTALDCENYSKTLMGWSDNPDTPNNKYLTLLFFFYGPQAQEARNNLVINKGWTIGGDNLDPDCQVVAVPDIPIKHFKAFPNPTTDKLYFEGVHHGNYQLHNVVGTLVDEGVLVEESISLRRLPPGFYFVSVTLNGQKVTAKVLKE